MYVVIQGMCKYFKYLSTICISVFFSSFPCLSRCSVVYFFELIPGKDTRDLAFPQGVGG